MAENDFFIGWLPVPRTSIPRLRLAAIVIISFAVGSALALALPQRHPGTGTWDDIVTTYEGVITAEPYAMLRTIAPDGSIMTVFLVEEGKHGARERAQVLEGSSVRVTGTLLHRDGLEMLELLPGDTGLQSALLPEETLAQLRVPSSVTVGPSTLHGEIVDSKCYLGGMKPGEGKTHRGCARLCLQGGIPPMFRTRDGQLLLLCDAEGQELEPQYFDLAGSSITISGIRVRMGNLETFRMHAVTDAKR
jgi:hypothetical protein